MRLCLFSKASCILRPFVQSTENTVTALENTEIEYSHEKQE